MRYRALASDYDGTLAARGVVDRQTLDALERARDRGVRLLLVSGRELESLQATFTGFTLFERMVLENGAVLYDPRRQAIRVLCEPPDPRFVATLRARGVTPLSVGRAVVATFVPHETTVVEVIRELGLESQVIFNKKAVMVLPSGVNKATGLRAALDELRIDPAKTVAIGDAENDHALLELCGVGAAVANALPALKERADYVASMDHGAGVVEILDRMLADSLRPSPRTTDGTLGTLARALSDDVEVHPDA